MVRTEVFKNPDLINDDNDVLFPGMDDLYDSTLSKGSRRHVSTQFDDCLDRKAARGGVWKNDLPDRSCQPRAVWRPQEPLSGSASSEPFSLLFTISFP